MLVVYLVTAVRTAACGAIPASARPRVASGGFNFSHKKQKDDGESD
jgi:hypothetical protein